MRVTFIILLFSLGHHFLLAQINLDSLSQELKTATDTNRVNIFGQLAHEYIHTDIARAMDFAQQGVDLGEQISFEKGKIFCLKELSKIYYEEGKYHLTDSLLVEVLSYYERVESNKEEADALLVLGISKERQGKFDEALQIYKKTLNIGHANQYIEIQTRSLNNMGNVFYRKTNYEQAIVHYQKVIQLKKGDKPDRLLAITYRNIGISYKRKGDYESSLDYCYKALAINESLNDPKQLAANWNSIGTILAVLNRPQKALESYQKGLAYLDQEKPIKSLYNLFLNIGQQYSIQNKQDSALYYYNQALSVSNRLEGFLSRGVLLYNIGTVYLVKKEYTKALTYYEDALLSEPEIEDHENHARIWMKMGLIYLKKREYLKSKLVLEKSLKKIEEFDIKESKSSVLEYLSEVHEKLGEPHKALNYYQRHVLIKDSLFNEEKAAQIQDLILANEQTQQDQKIATLEQEKKVQQLSKERLWMGLIGLSIIALLIFFFQRKRVEYAQQQERLLSIQKNWLELQSLRNQFKPHFVFNALASIQHFLILKKTDKAEHYLGEFAQLMRELLENTEKDNILLEDEINFLHRYLSIEQVRSNHQFEFEIFAEEQLEHSDILIPNLLLQPIIENAICHGIAPKKKKGKIMLRFRKDKAWLFIEIEDDGVGRNYHKKDQHVSKGLDLLQKRIDALNEKGDEKIRWHIEDLEDQNQKPRGTKVCIDYLVEAE